MVDFFSKSKKKQLKPLTMDLINEVHWSTVSNFNQEADNLNTTENYSGKILIKQNFENANLKNASFSVANLTDANFTKANLEGVDFSGANLSGANFSEANLSGATLNGAILKGTNFTGANLNGARLVDADIEDAILVDAILDEIAIKDLQELVEILAKYYPHKLNLSKLNLTMLDLSKIDLTKVNLKGVDFTGVSFVGINIYELDLSECVITPQQIEQAIGHKPTPDELKKILAPKPKAKQLKSKSVDLTSMFYDDGSEFGMINAWKYKGLDITKQMFIGKQVFKDGAKRPEQKNEQEEPALDVSKEISERQAIKSKIEKRKEELKKYLDEDRVVENAYILLNGENVKEISTKSGSTTLSKLDFDNEAYEVQLVIEYLDEDGETIQVKSDVLKYEIVQPEPTPDPVKPKGGCGKKGVELFVSLMAASAVIGILLRKRK